MRILKPRLEKIDEITTTMAAEGRITDLTPTCMESVNRIAKFPVVETTLQTATNIYEKVKDLNSVTQWTCSTAENAVGAGKTMVVPIVQSLEGPIKKVDGVLCTGLDYVETKVPAVKLPPGEILSQIYNSTKDYVTGTVNPAVKSAYEKIEPTIESARHNVVDPAVERAKQVIDPAVQSAMPYVQPVMDRAKEVVEPLVQPALDKAHALIDSGTHKLEEFLAAGRCNHETPEEDTDCPECQAAAAKKKNASPEKSKQSGHPHKE